MAYLMRDDISVGEVATAAEAPFHVLEEGRIEIDLLVSRAIERAHGRLGATAARSGPPTIEDELWLGIGNPFLPWQDFRPNGFVRRENGGDELAHVVGGRPGLSWLHRVGLAALAHAVHHFRAADQKSGIDAERPAEEAQNHHGSNSKTALAGHAATAAPVLDIVRTAEILPSHKRLPLVILSHPAGATSRTTKLEVHGAHCVRKWGRLSPASAGDAHMPRNRGLRVLAIDDEIMAL